MALDQVRCIFYAVQATSAEFGMHSENKKFSTQNEA
jgi:hypothetical protein